MSILLCGNGISQKMLKQKRKTSAFNRCLSLGKIQLKSIFEIDGTVAEERPFWAAARVRRTSVFAAGENLGAGGIDFRRAFKYQRVEVASGGRNPKRKTRLTSCLSFWHARRDSNPQHSEPESDALSIELRARIKRLIIIAGVSVNVKYYF